MELFSYLLLQLFLYFFSSLDDRSFHSVLQNRSVAVGVVELGGHSLSFCVDRTAMIQDRGNPKGFGGRRACGQTADDFEAPCCRMNSAANSAQFRAEKWRL